MSSDNSASSGTASQPSTPSSRSSGGTIQQSNESSTPSIDRPVNRNIDQDIDTSHEHEKSDVRTGPPSRNIDADIDVTHQHRGDPTSTKLPEGARDALDMTADPYERYYKGANYILIPPPRSRFIRHCVGTFMVGLIACTYYIVPVWFLSSLIGSLFLFPPAILGLITLITLAYTPHPSKETAKFFRNHWIMRTIAEYFSLRWIEDTPISTFSMNEKYVSVWVPHGIIPFAGIAIGPQFDAVAPEYYGRSVQQPIVTRFPILRQIFSVFRGIPSDKHSLIRALKQGDNISIWTGGLAEIFVSDPNKEIVYLNSRKGFVKIAITTGAHITPYYCFGNNHMFNSTNSMSTGGEKSYLAKFSRKVGASLTFFWGRYGLPLPFKTKVTIVRGPKIEVKQSDKPSQEQIDETHHRVVEAIRTLHDKYKHIAGPQHANKVLIVR